MQKETKAFRIYGHIAATTGHEEIRRLFKSMADEEQMQADIDALKVWATKWLLTFHPAKCKVMRIGSKEPPTTSYHMTTNHVATTLAWSSLKKDLGVLVDNTS